MEMLFEHNGGEVRLLADRTADGWSVRLPDGAVCEVHCEPAADTDPLLVLKGSAAGPVALERRFTVPCVREGSLLTFVWEGRAYSFTRGVSGRAAARASADPGNVTAPTGGVVVDLLIAEGQPVEPYQQICVIEAMKVMTPVEAPHAGVVGKLFVTKGQRIEQGAQIAKIESPAQMVTPS